MKKIIATSRSTLAKPNKMKVEKQRVKTQINTKKLERSPKNEYFDYSTEEKGFFTKRDSKGNILQVFELMFRR